MGCPQLTYMLLWVCKSESTGLMTICICSLER